MEKPVLIKENVPLAPFTTLGVGGSAHHFATARTVLELEELIVWAGSQRQRITVIGGGSNILVSDSGIEGLVIQMGIQGESYVVQDDGVYVTVGAGVSFDEFIEHAVLRGLWGVENLSAIPGTVGAVPIQNVGAYGVEAEDVIVSVTAFDTELKTITTLMREQCLFAYRDSLFKHVDGKRYIVTAVTFKLSKVPQPKLSYKDLKSRFSDTREPSLIQIREAVILIRAGKFPDWLTIGTAGSFFKNPIVDSEMHAQISERYPDIPTYSETDGRYKIALGWILDRVLGLKGYRKGNVGLYEHQALVLVNHGGATEHEIHAFSQHIIEKIFDATNIHVQCEVVSLK